MKTIAVISSPITAVGAAILALKGEVDICIIETYIDYTDKKYVDLIQGILKNTAVKKIYTLKCYLYQKELYKHDFFKLIREIRYNRKIIDEFNKKNFQGKLFQGEYKFISERLSPLLSLSNYPLENVSLIDHSPLDILERLNLEQIEGIYRESNTSYIANLKKMYNKIASELINIILKHKYLYTSIFSAPNGFTWIKVPGDSFKILDYREFSIKKEAFLENEYLNQPKTLFLVDPKEIYKTGQIFSDLKDVDYIDKQIEILKKNATTHEFIVCKYHQFTSEVFSEKEIFLFRETVKYKLESSGYRMCFWDELILDEDVKMFPAEVVLIPLNITKLICIHSSLTWTAAQCPNIEVISDCSNIPYFNKRMQLLKKVLPCNFKVYL